MKKLFIIVVTIAAVSLFFVFEKGEKPLSSAQMIQRLNQAGFEVLPQEKLLLYPDQEALFPTGSSMQARACPASAASALGITLTTPPLNSNSI